jgi:hypothetical protein
MNGTALGRPSLASEPRFDEGANPMTTPKPASGTGAPEQPVWEPALDQDPAEEAASGEVGPAPVTKPRARVGPRRVSSVTVMLVVSALIAVGGIGFAVGHSTTSGQTGATTQDGNAGRLGPNASGIPADGQRGGFGGVATVTGTVVSVSADSITVKLADGSTVTVATGSSTTYHNQTAGSSTDLAAGQTVQVQTSGGTNGGPNASASPGTQTTRTATDVTITK